MCSDPSNSADQAAFCGWGIANQEEDENHADEWNQASEDHERVEEVCARGDAGVGKPACQFDYDDRAEGRASSAQAADGGDGVTGKKIGRQNVGDGGKTRVRKSGQRKEKCEQRQVDGKDRGNQKRDTDATEDYQGFARISNGPATLDEVAGDGSAKKIAEVSGNEGNPDGNESVAQRNTFGDEVDGEPIGDKKENGIGKGPGNNDAPGLREFEKIAPA